MELGLVSFGATMRRAVSRGCDADTPGKQECNKGHYVSGLRCEPRAEQAGGVRAELLWAGPGVVRVGVTWGRGRLTGR
jgi:hypothetical protein